MQRGSEETSLILHNCLDPFNSNAIPEREILNSTLNRNIVISFEPKETHANMLTKFAAF